MNKIAEAEAAKYRAVQAYNEGVQRLESQLTNAILEEREREEAAKAAMEARKRDLALEDFKRVKGQANSEHQRRVRARDSFTARGCKTSN